jgi:hypothetical protein
MGGEENELLHGRVSCDSSNNNRKKELTCCIYGSEVTVWCMGGVWYGGAAMVVHWLSSHCQQHFFV